MRMLLPLSFGQSHTGKQTAFLSSSILSFAVCTISITSTFCETHWDGYIMRSVISVQKVILM